MKRTEPDVDDAVRGVLDGTPVDWSGLETSDDLDTRDLTAQLKILSAIGTVHRSDALEGIGRWGHLRILERVGAGAFGEVYRAWDTRLDREVALKLLPASEPPDDGAPLIIEEGRLLARVRHPNVATIYGAELIDGRVGLWMEFIRGRTLEDLLRSGHQFSLNEVVEIGLELCRAVSAVHAAGLLHRDIKAHNVMRADDGRIVLMDFGAGRESSDTGTANTVGTPLYLAPEVLAGHAATPQSDVYSTGVLLHHLLTGRYPVNATSIEELRRAHANDERVDLRTVRPELPSALLLVVGRATAARLEDRYQSSEAMAADLLPLTAKPTRWRAAVVTTAAALAIGVAWVAWDRIGFLRESAATGSEPVAAATVASRADRPVIVVRPFRNLRSDVDSEFLADGLTYEIIRSLAVIDGMDVRSATSSFALKGKEITLAGIGQQLGVSLVLEGSVSGSGDQVRVQAQLSNVASDTPLWTSRFDRRITDVLAIEDEIARAVVNQLRLTLGRGQRRYNLDGDTAAVYLKARTLIDRRGQDDPEAAVPLLQQVIARDPSFAPAHAALADAYAYMSQALPDVLGMHHLQALELMRTTAQKAIELDPLLAEAHAAMGVLYSRENAWEEAQRSFDRAVELNPGLTHVVTSYSLTTLEPLGRADYAETLLREALRRDPLSLDAKRQLGALWLLTGRYAEALRVFEEIAAVDPNYPYLVLLVARTQSLAGRIEDAMPYWNSVRHLVGSQQWMAYAFVRVGRRPEIEQIAAQPQVAYRQVLFYAALGDKDRALESLARAADEAPHRTVRLLQYPEIASLRGDPRFEAVRRRFHLP